MRARSLTSHSLIPIVESLEPRLMLSTVTFEGAGEENQFISLYNSPTVARVYDGADQGYVLDLFRNNNVGSVKYSPDGDYTQADGTVGADVHLQYYWDAAYGDTGPAQSLILKEWTDGLGQHGGYVVTLMPRAGHVEVWIGASKAPGAGVSNWDFYRGGSGHSDFLHPEWSFVPDYTATHTTGVHDLGWWSVSAAVDTVDEGAGVRVSVSLIDPNHPGESWQYAWTDTGPEAVTDPGRVGLSVYGLWNVHAQFDDFQVLSEADQPPTVYISSESAPTATEAGPAAGTVEISRGDRTDGDLTVYYTVSGTAGAEEYAETLSGSVVIPDGQSSTGLTITPVDDGDIEPDQTVTVTLAEDPAYTVAPVGSATVTIVSDDLPTVTLAADDAGAAERGQDVGTFVVARAGEGELTDEPLTVWYSVAGSATEGDDYTGTSTRQVIIPAGQVSSSITILPTDDAQAEADETVILSLTPGGYQIGAADEAGVTIVSDDVAVLAETPEALEGGEAGQFVIYRGTTTGDLTVYYAVSGTAAGQDYSPELTGSVVIPDGEDGVAIGISAAPDGLIESNETLIVTLAPGDGYSVADADTATVTIVNADLPEVSIEAVDPVADEGAADPATFTVSRQGLGELTAGELVVFYTISGTASDGEDYAALSGSVTIQAGQTTAPIAIAPIDDGQIEQDESVILTLAAGAGYVVGSPAVDTAVITGDNDVPAVTITATDPAAAEAGPDAGEFTITRWGQGLLTEGDLLVHYAVAEVSRAGDGDVAETLSGCVTIPDGRQSVTITVTPVSDGTYERSEALVLALIADQDGDDYEVGLPAQAAVVIADQDVPAGPVQTDFELPGTEGDFADLFGSPVISRLVGHGGHVLDLWKSNSVGSVRYSPQGDYLLAEGTIRVEAYLRYYNTIGTPHSLIVKGWDTPGHPGGYVVTLQPRSGGVELSIGASRAPGAGTEAWDFYNASSGHSDPLRGAVVAGYEQEADDTVNEVGWWRIEAAVTVVGGGTGVQIDVTLTDPDGDAHGPYTWTDWGASAVTGEGVVGVSAMCLWSIHGQFDNFTILPAGADAPATAAVEATDDAMAEEGADAGVFTISRTGGAAEPMTVFYVISGTADSGDYVPAEGLTGWVRLAAGQSSATITLTPVDDDFDEGDETVRITLIGGFGYFVDADGGTARVRIADNDAHPAETVVLDFETPGQEDLLPLRTAGVSGRAAGNYGHVLDLFRSNSSALLTYDPEGLGYTMGEGTVRADVHLQYVNDVGDHTLGSSVSLVLKEWTDDRDQHGAYVVTLMPVDGEVQVWIGASSQAGAGTARWDFYRAGAGHTKPLAEHVLAEYAEDLSPGMHSLGWWTVEADLTVITEGSKDEVRIDVTIVDDQGNAYPALQWTDKKKAAMTGRGRVGLAARGLWSIHGQFDNFVIVPEGANEPPVVRAGADQVAVLAESVVLDAEVLDDGLPAEPGAVTVAWTQIAGPAAAAFADPGAIDTTVTFPATGVYVLQLQADDGEWTDADTLTVRVGATAEFEEATSTAEEAGATIAVTVRLGGAMPVPVSLDYALSGSAVEGIDYTVLTPGPIVFSPGQTSRDILIAIVDDALAEYPETIVLDLISDDPNVPLGPTTRHVHTISDADPDPIIGFSQAAFPDSESIGDGVVTVVLSGPSGKTVSAGLAVLGGTAAATGEQPDYSLEAGWETVVFAPGRTVRHVLVHVADDDLREPWEEDIVFGIDGPSVINATVGTAAPYLPEAAYVIQDNDGVWITVGGDDGADQGQPCLLTLATLYPGDDRVVAWQVDWGDGRVAVYPGTESAVTHAFAASGAYDVLATALDADGFRIEAGRAVYVSNVAPVVDGGADAAAAEGAAFVRSITVTDPDLSSVAVTVDYGDGVVEPLSAGADGTCTLDHVYEQDGTYTVTIEAADYVASEGRTDYGGDQIVVTVANVSPTADAGMDAVVTEGAPFVQAGVYADAGV
ncbi:MAG TPA: Calx-beta domain-containing protein, partial [Phycisphaerae bacterium]|nr:Calx-beta domain-containing protein [Phycisphaerae bacterium]